MSKVTSGSIDLMAMPLDCGHALVINVAANEPQEGDKVDCLVCADIEKRVKAAGMAALEKARDECLKVDYNVRLQGHCFASKIQKIIEAENET